MTDETNEAAQETVPTDGVLATEPQVEQSASTDAATDDQTADTGEPETFSAEYVKQLRQEAATHRIRAKRTDEANERMVRTIAEMDGRLINADEFALSDDMLDDDGIVDPSKVREAIGSLLDAKPYLAKRTPTTPLPMGVRQTDEPAPSLFQMVRERI